MKPLGVIFLIAFITVRVAAQSTTSTSQPLGPFRVIITGIEGNCQARASVDLPWQKAEVGMVLLEGAEFRTGTRSAVRFTIPPDQTVTLDRLGTVQVLEASFRDGKIMTDLGMKYGRVRYEIEGPERDHDTSVRSPSYTLAVRGTQVSIYDQPPFTPEAVSLTGRAQFRDANKQLAFGGKGAGKTVVRTDKDSPADVSLSQSFVDPSIAYARTPTEQRLIQDVVSRGGVLSFEPGNPVPIVRGGTIPVLGDLLDDAVATALASGKSNFIFAVTWTGNADLNLTAAWLNGGELVTPIFPLNRAASGGVTAFDHRGGPTGGYEIIEWPNFPGHLAGDQDDQIYLRAIEAISVKEPTTFQYGDASIEDDGNVVMVFDPPRTFSPVNSAPLNTSAPTATALPIVTSASVKNTRTPVKNAPPSPKPRNSKWK